MTFSEHADTKHSVLQAGGFMMSWEMTCKSLGSRQWKCHMCPHKSNTFAVHIVTFQNNGFIHFPWSLSLFPTPYYWKLVFFEGSVQINYEGVLCSGSWLYSGSIHNLALTRLIWSWTYYTRPLIPVWQGNSLWMAVWKRRVKSNR